MTDANGNVIQIGDRVKTLFDDQVIPVGAIGEVKRVIVESNGPQALVEHPDWLGWYTSKEIELVPAGGNELPRQFQKARRRGT